MKHLLPLLMLVLTAVSVQAKPLHIILDPGHGGADDGAIRGKVREASIALSVAKKLADRLNSDPRFEVTLTRDSDRTLALPERTKIASEAHGDLFMSIHANASADTRATGVEFYFQNQMPADEESSFLANVENQSMVSESGASSGEDVTHHGDVSSILEDLKRNHRISQSNDLSRLLLTSWTQDLGNKHSRNVRQAPFYVVQESKMPSVLVELGFVSNPNEGARLTDPAHQERMAKSLYSGLVEFKTIYDRDHR
jgi:N-acetylmuramoyl-L-alanine amidase